MVQTLNILEQNLQTVLLAERERLDQCLRSLAVAGAERGESQRDESGPGGDQADIASDLAEQSLSLALERAEAERRLDVQAALQRLDDGTFGRCERCGREITPARLIAMPWARHCLACAALLSPRPKARIARR